MKHQPARAMTLLGAMAVLLWVQLSADLVQAQSGDCGYDRRKPSVENARQSFRIFDFQCAEQELLDLLGTKTLSIEEKANAHVLLAAVYFEMLQNDAQRRGKIIEQFKEAFRSYRDWRGDLDIQSPEFRALMEEAREDLQAEANAEQPADSAVSAPVVARPPHEGGESKKGGSKKWILIGLGVGAVGVAALALGGGGGSNGNGDNSLPGFPSHPEGSK